MLARRIATLWKAIVGDGLNTLEERHPQALLRLERERLQRSVAKYDRGLAGYASWCERAKGQLARLHEERVRLEPALLARLSAGDRVAAGRHALRLESVADQIERRGDELRAAEGTYKELLSMRDVALLTGRDQMEALAGSIVELRAQQGLAELSELAATMHSAAGVSDNDLQRLRERVEDGRVRAAGRVRFARDLLASGDGRAPELERVQLADIALRRFEASRALYMK